VEKTNNRLPNGAGNTKANLQEDVTATPSLLDGIEKAVRISNRKPKTQELKEMKREELKTILSFIGGKLKLTSRQALIFSHILDKSASRPVTQPELAKSLKCSNIRLLKYLNAIEALEKKGLILHGKSVRRESAYCVPLNVIRSLRKGKQIKPIRYCNLKSEELFYRFEKIYESREDEENTLEFFITEIIFLLDDNMHLDFCRFLKEYKLCKIDLVFFILLCNRLVRDEKDDYDIGYLKHDKNYFDTVEMDILYRGLRRCSNDLFEKGLIEYIGNDGLKDTKSVMVSQKARDELLADFDLQGIGDRNKNGLIPCAELKEKRLFYNEKEAAQIKRLASLLREDNFKNIVDRLSDSNMRTGFACLFSGSPGTGKTETAYQLARDTGRDIMPVEISKTKSMWFGQSEKIIKSIFDRYRSRVRRSQKMGEKEPILLFNEADAVIGKRRQIGESNLAQTENTIQNIILEEMEKFEGILIATTNLAGNMDAAFERRFLFKIEFEKPNLEVRKNIWQNLLPELPLKNCGELAYTFDLSGGQIENIARKFTVETVLNGTTPNFETVVGFCREELLAKKSPRIGFVAN
jgi:hypothetical protein